jgi:murein DD-endopeptidase MepM/ murein hydrolase activator NlpD
VVIEAENPYRSGKVYIGFEHLSAISVTEGQEITDPGHIIGLSGGTRYAPCNDSVDPHLHFQVDKPHGGPYPWFPTGEVETPDDDFEVMDKTYNPIVFVKGRQIWSFDESNFKELWVPTGVDSAGVSGGALWLNGSSGNAAIERGPTISPCSVFPPSAPCSTQLSVDTTVTPKLHMRARFKCHNNPAKVSVQRSNGSWAVRNFNYMEGVSDYSISLDDLSLSDGIITNIRINPSEGCTAQSREYRFLRISLCNPAVAKSECHE